MFTEKVNLWNIVMSDVTMYCGKVIFSQVCVGLSFGGPHVAITHDAWDLTVQGPSHGPPFGYETWGPQALAQDLPDMRPEDPC